MEQRGMEHSGVERNGAKWIGQTKRKEEREGENSVYQTAGCTQTQTAESSTT